MIRTISNLTNHNTMHTTHVQAPTPAELEIESSPYEGLCCDGRDGNVEASKSHSHGGIPGQVPQLSDTEKSQMLQEVEAQQADFGIQK